MRGDRRTKWYQRGAWALGEESDVVNTSGNGLFDRQWQYYCESLQEEAEEMDFEMEKKRKEIGDEEVQGKDEVIGDEGVVAKKEELDDGDSVVEREQLEAVDLNVQPLMETVKVKGLAKAIAAIPHARKWR